MNITLTTTTSQAYPYAYHDSCNHPLTIHMHFDALVTNGLIVVVEVVIGLAILPDRWSQDKCATCVSFGLCERVASLRVRAQEACRAASSSKNGRQHACRVLQVEAQRAADERRSGTGWTRERSRTHSQYHRSLPSSSHGITKDAQPGRTPQTSPAGSQCSLSACQLCTVAPVIRLACRPSGRRG